MSTHRPSGNHAVILRETPEQAAQAISHALDYLRFEAIAIGMLDVGELIDHARARAIERAVANRSRAE